MGGRMRKIQDFYSDYAAGRKPDAHFLLSFFVCVAMDGFLLYNAVFVEFQDVSQRFGVDCGESQSMVERGQFNRRYRCCISRAVRIYSSYDRDWYAYVPCAADTFVSGRAKGICRIIKPDGYKNVAVFVTFLNSHGL